MNELILFIGVMTICLIAFLAVGVLVIGVLFLIEYRKNHDIKTAWKCACESKIEGHAYKITGM